MPIGLFRRRIPRRRRSRRNKASGARVPAISSFHTGEQQRDHTVIQKLPHYTTLTRRPHRVQEYSGLAFPGARQLSALSSITDRLTRTLSKFSLTENSSTRANHRPDARLRSSRHFPQG